MRSESDHNDQPKIPLSTQDALKLVSSFLGKEWAQTDISAVRIRTITGGLINTLQLIERSTVAVLEPPAVLIRHFGRSGKLEEPTCGSLTLSSGQQAVVYSEMARRGWGPKIFGLFHGGRLEEYLDAHTLTAAESLQADIARDVARSYARLHSLRLPLRRDNFEVVIRDLNEAVQAKSRHVVGTLLEVEDPVATEYAGMFGSLDWSRELRWISELFQRHNCKLTVTHGDANYLNILVKNFESEIRVALIDYETVSYSHRGIDIGGHFHERMYCYDQPDSQLSGFEAPNRDEQTLFCEAYLQEMRDLGDELSEHDTIDHLILEAEIGRLCHILVTNLMCTVYDEVEIEPLFLSGLLHSMRTYEQLKREFLSAH